MIQHVGGRKFLAALVMLMVAGGLVALKGDIPPNAMTFLEFVFGALITGNVATKISNAVAASRSAPASSDVVESTPLPVDNSAEFKALADALGALGQNDAVLAENVSIIQQTLSLIIRKLQIDKMPDPQ